MGIYIKGMKMPERCWDCYFCYDCVYCLAVDVQFSDKEDFEPSERRLSDCPLVPVPPHGRLIDADAVEVNDGWLAGAEGYRTHISFVYSNDIDNAPTVIPAEEGEIS